ncbi:MAG: site-specific DNA-methyltransferase [Pirellulales bacterium]|nr:site-specific DNA-methyltransferase [Pirellulales bacterium]
MVHLTEKPVEFAVRAIQYSSLSGANVLDLFGGSDSTLIGYEQTGRKAFLTELDPLYCDVIVQRWEKFTGRKAERWSIAHADAVVELAGRKDWYPLKVAQRQELFIASNQVVGLTSDNRSQDGQVISVSECVRGNGRWRNHVALLAEHFNNGRGLFFGGFELPDAVLGELDQDVL